MAFHRTWTTVVYGEGYNGDTTQNGEIKGGHTYEIKMQGLSISFGVDQVLCVAMHTMQFVWQQKASVFAAHAIRRFKSIDNAQGC